MSSENTENTNITCGIFDFADTIWAKYKHHSGKVSIGLSVLGFATSILIGKYVIIGSVGLAITNTAIFFSGIAYEKLNVENTKISSENESLQNDKKELAKRLTMFHFPNESPQKDDITISNVSTNTHYEEVKQFNLNSNIITFNSEPTAFT